MRTITKIWPNYVPPEGMYKVTVTKLEDEQLGGWIVRLVSETTDEPVISLIIDGLDPANKDIMELEPVQIAKIFRDDFVTRWWGRLSIREIEEV